MAKRKIAIFTGNRAEYGLQFPIIRAIDKHNELDYSLLVSGSHLDSHFGQTLNEIKSDGFKIGAEIKIEMDHLSRGGTAQAIGSGVQSISQALEKLDPDIMIVYADRYEGFSAAIAASQMNIPTAHIEGGDLTEGGALDDSVRHAITKLSHLHFTTNSQAKNRVLAMGEESWRVHLVGLPAIDCISTGDFANEEEILHKLSLDANRPIILFTQHSITTEFNKALSQIKPSIDALKKAAHSGAQVIITYPNNDAGGKDIIHALKALKGESIKGVQIHPSLGRYNYHGVLALAKNDNIKIACIGNSSSGMKETPVFGCPTINIGSRQQGRLHGNNVVHAHYNAREISHAIDRCFNDQAFRQSCATTKNPYYVGGAGDKIAEILANTKLGKKLLRKKMMLRGKHNEGWYQ